ncbi:putative protease [Candidatus Magnetomoraceae bacterium gMMP-15]
MPELLGPAGTLEKLKWAVRYGADAVYFGTKEFSLRNFAGNFSIDDAQEGMSYLHKRGKKGYVALNIYPFSSEYTKLIQTAHLLEEIGVDAFIISDPGVLFALKKAGIKTRIHISTQANTMSYQTILAYKEMGASRVNLARELSLEQIREMQKNLKGQDIETEVFIHGAVCFSYSGRCAISDYLTGRRANRGECTHPCRWKYCLVEEQRPGEYMPVAEDNRGLYFFNSKELALFPFMQELMDMGIKSFKIEGRMKSIHYIASILSFYRKIMDGEKFSDKRGMELLNRVRNRGYSYGFMKGGIEPDDYAIDKSGTGSESDTVFLGNVLDEIIDNYSVLEVRNKIHAGDEVEILRPEGKLGKMTLPSPLLKKDGSTGEFANHHEFLLLKKDLEPYTIIRKVKKF